MRLRFFPDLDESEITIEDIEYSLGRECREKDIPIGDHLRIFDIEMETVALWKNETLYVEALPEEMDDVDTVNSMLSYNYQAMCTTGVLTCQAIIGYALDDEGMPVVALSHSLYDAPSAKAKIQKLMLNAKVSNQESIRFILVGGTSDTLSDVKKQFVDEKNIFYIAENKNSKLDEEEADGEYCNVYIHNGIAIIQQYHPDDHERDIKCTYFIDLRDNPIFIKLFDHQGKFIHTQAHFFTLPRTMRMRNI